MNHIARSLLLILAIVQFALADQPAKLQLDPSRDAPDVAVAKAEWKGPSTAPRYIPRGLLNSIRSRVQGDISREADRDADALSHRGDASVVVRNLGCRDVVTLELLFDVIDIRGTTVDRFDLLFDHQVIKPGSSVILRKKFPYNDVRQAVRSEAQVIAVKYSDGTSWTRLPAHHTKGPTSPAVGPPPFDRPRLPKSGL
jgi:hypothetical protein